MPKPMIILIIVLVPMATVVLVYVYIPLFSNHIDKLFGEPIGPDGNIENIEPSVSSYKEADLLGGWIDRKNDHQMVFALEGGQPVFNSWQDTRPELSNCSWSIVTNEVKVNCSTLSDAFTITSLSGDTLAIDREGVLFTYERKK